MKKVSVHDQEKDRACHLFCVIQCRFKVRAGTFERQPEQKNAKCR